MYATCLFCNASLGTNESLEAFPVGTRLAFDAAKGRLWAVCRKCERWSLSPLDERWEAIEQAERLYRDAKRRVATDNIGLARLRDGTTLVRIGEPLRPEFAAWRYGDQFGRRRYRQLLIAGGSVAAVGALMVGGWVAGAGFMGVNTVYQVSVWTLVRRAKTVVAKIRTDDGTLMHMRRLDLRSLVLSRGEEGRMVVHLPYLNGARRFVGAEAQRIAGLVVPNTNLYGGKRKDVATAVGLIEDAGSGDRFVDQLTQASYRFTPAAVWSGRDNVSKFMVGGLPTPQRLALEMVLHEDAERRALEGELADLKRAWKDAEEIAAISDDLLLPSSVTDAVERLQR